MRELPGLDQDPGIHAVTPQPAQAPMAWIAGSSPAMTAVGLASRFRRAAHRARRRRRAAAAPARQLTTSGANSGSASQCGTAFRKHAALLLCVEALARFERRALAGDHQHMLQPASLRGFQESPQLRMRVALAQARAGRAAPRPRAAPFPTRRAVLRSSGARVAPGGASAPAARLLAAALLAWLSAAAAGQASRSGLAPEPSRFSGDARASTTLAQSASSSSSGPRHAQPSFRRRLSASAR